MHLHVHKDIDALSFAVADWVVNCIRKRIEDQDRFTWLLSGGSTPRRLYSLLATTQYSQRIDWSKLHIFFGDERVVPFEHADNNGRMASDSLLFHVPVPRDQIHYIPTTGEPAECADEYERLLRQYFGNGTVTFDLALLGMGDDAHTLSLFPESPLIPENKEKWVAAVFSSARQMYRITLTPEVVNASRQTVFLVSGASKAFALKQVMKGDHNPKKYPAQLIRPRHGELHWFIDEAAGGEL